MNILDVIAKLKIVVNSDEFIRYEKLFAEGLYQGLQIGYLQRDTEPKIVKIIENVINNIPQNKISISNTNVNIITKSIFIHGNKSQVEFKYFTTPTQRELGDLIFIISILLNKEKYLEKFTITQFKKDNPKTAKIAWNLGSSSSKEQLFLLSRFPTFRGTNGSIIPQKYHSLQDNSRCLGSYGLLHKPGDFVFLSARNLDLILGLKKSTSLRNLSQYGNLSNFPFLLSDYFPGNYHYASNIYDFSHKYLSFGIGEPVFIDTFITNTQCRNFLRDLMASIIKRCDEQAARLGINGRDENIADSATRIFAEEFLRVKYADDFGGNSDIPIPFNIDMNRGGIGILHTTIDFDD